MTFMNLAFALAALKALQAHAHQAKLTTLLDGYTLNMHGDAEYTAVITRTTDLSPFTLTVKRGGTTIKFPVDTGLASVQHRLARNWEADRDEAVHRQDVLRAA